MFNINHQKGDFLIFITVIFIMNSGCIYKGTNEENDASNKGTTIQITNFNSTKYWPDIFDDKIVWADNRNGNFDIYFYNITTSSESRITTNESDQIYPMIWGDYIIWLDFRFDLNGKLDTMYTDAVGFDDYGEVFIYKISSGEESRLSKDGTLDEPIIDDHYVFWDSGGGNLTRYNIITGELKVISINTSYIANFDVSGNYIVWEDDRYYHDPGPVNEANKT